MTASEEPKLRQRKNESAEAKSAAPGDPQPPTATTKLLAKPTPPGAKKPTTKIEVFVLGAILVMLFVPTLMCYWVFGKHFFLPPEWTRLQHSPVEWQEMLRNRTVVFIGGSHQGGYNVLWQALAMHPDISAFPASRRGTGTDDSEGMSLQSVYPRFALGGEHNRGQEGGAGNNRWQPRGLGRYALAPEHEVHWTETHVQMHPENQALLLNEYGRFWELGARPILLDKSPQTAVLSRFLQALLNQGNGPWLPAPGFGGASRSVAKFIFITRHPLADAYAHRAVHACKDEKLSTLLSNWLALHEYLEADAAQLQAVLRLRLEDFAAEPALTIAKAWAWLGLPPRPELAQAAAEAIAPESNAKYVAQHCTAYGRDPAKLQAFLAAAGSINERVRALKGVGGGGYDLLAPEWRCEGGGLPEPPAELELKSEL